jgi:hypothetical protein
MLTPVAGLDVSEPPECPVGALRYGGIFVGSQLLQNGLKAAVAAVAHGDGGVTPEAVAFGAFYRRAAKFLAEFFCADRRQPFQRGIY